MAQEKFTDRVLEGDINISLDGKRVWQADKNDLVGKIVFIIEKYQREGYKLTLRQLYYQMVARDWIPNHDKVYKKLSKILDDCRYSGLVDWDAIEDRGRVPYTPYTEADVSSAIKRTEMFYNLDKRDGQPYHTELWSDKDISMAKIKREIAVLESGELHDKAKTKPLELMVIETRNQDNK